MNEGEGAAGSATATTTQEGAESAGKQTTTTADENKETGAATTTTQSADDDLEGGDWIDKSKLDDNQKKYVRRLMTEGKNRKEALADAKAKLAEFEKRDADAKRKELEEQGKWKEIADENELKLKAKDERIVRAEVRAHAVKEGIVDPSIINHLPLEGVTIDDAGEVSGVDKWVAALKKDKAYLFTPGKEPGPEGTTNSKTNPAPTTKVVTKDAMDMTAEEFAAAKAELKRPGKK